MQMFLKPLTELAEYDEIRSRIRKGPGIISLAGCARAQKAHMIYGLSYDAKITLVVTENDLAAKALYEDLLFYEPGALFYPAKDLLFYQADITSNLLDIQRMRVFRALIEDERVTVVVPVAAMMDMVSVREDLTDARLVFEMDEEVDLDWIRESLVRSGYERCPEVSLPGQFAVRGSIIDIWSLTEERPFRIELFGDEIDSMRSFDPESQRSIENLQKVMIYPAADNIGRKAGLSRWFPTGKDGNIADECVIFLDEPTHILEAAGAVENEFRESVKMRIEQGDYRKDEKIPEILGVDRIVSDFNRSRCIALSALDMRKGDWNITAAFGQTVQAVSSYNGSFEFLVGDIKKYRKRGYRVIVMSASHTRARRLAQDLDRQEVPAFYTEDEKLELQSGQVAVVYGRASRGFEYPLIRLAVITETDILGTKPKKRKKRTRYSGEKIASFNELHVGDPVVHENRGVAIYRGIEQVKVDDVLKDYIKLEYKDGNLYVLATQLDVLQKYTGGGENSTPKLNRLSGQEWEKTRAKVKSSVRSIAKELIALYAVRENSQGFAFGEDTEWQKEFEELFPFEETEDQLIAIEDTKRDMQSHKIMDRLICGDVGYGKTEIALRAAFKAVQDGKQVAYLVPTTILAQQHYNTFIQRMKEFPVNIALLCRFVSSAQIKKTISDLKKGLVDIVIGTHRLLSKDVAFKDLGLLIIDEEQRFGVTHKEKIKNLRKNVDALTLTATPIPRTLHMSLVGIRDMTVLEEPPQDRVPIQTYVMEFNQEMVREAICRELARGGQVYYVYNRVRDIADMTLRIQNLVPEANVAFADGQMNKRQLEDIMYDFINGEIDVLVTTTIIETGLDISNANTIIIHDADRMGLSQLYQLRGRVGRSNRTAYAFLMYRKDKQLKEVAEKRLAAIREFTELGSGFKIAMRDLEIRGAGDLLGREQSGHMDLVGYDLYCKMLALAVKAEKGEVPEESYETVIDINVDAYIPDFYISDEFQKLDFYKKIAAIENGKDYEDISDELMDRFGELPKTVRNLLLIAELKAIAHSASIEEIKQRSREVRLTVRPDPTFDTAQLGRIIGSFAGMFTVHQSPKGAYFLYHGPVGTEEMAENLKRFASELASTAKNV